MFKIMKLGITYSMFQRIGKIQFPFSLFITYEQRDLIFHRPPFDPTSTNNIRGAGKVMHDGIEYYIYLWAESLFICNKDDFGQNR